MPYLLFLKKRQNLKLSSAANYRWRFNKGLRINLASDGGYQALLEDRFSDLRDKLGKAQLLNRQRENDLHILRSQFNYLVQLLSTNQTDNR